MTQTHIRLSAFMLTGAMDQHALVPGIVEAAYRAHHGGSNWRKGLRTGGRKASRLRSDDRADDASVLQSEASITRAALFIAQRVKNKTEALKSLQLNCEANLSKQRNAPIQPCSLLGEQVLLPCSYQSINFDGAVVETVMRAHTIIRQCLGLSLCVPALLYMMFDGSYVAKCLDIAPPWNNV